MPLEMRKPRQYPIIFQKRLPIQNELLAQDAAAEKIGKTG